MTSGVLSPSSAMRITPGPGLARRAVEFTTPFSFRRLYMATELASPTFPASRGSSPLVFDHCVVSRVNNGLVAVGRPPHQVRRLPMLPTDFHDLGIPFGLTDAMAFDDQPIAGFGSHLTSKSTDASIIR